MEDRAATATDHRGVFRVQTDQKVYQGIVNMYVSITGTRPMVWSAIKTEIKTFLNDNCSPDGVLECKCFDGRKMKWYHAPHNLAPSLCVEVIEFVP